MNRTSYEAPLSLDAPAIVRVEYGRVGGRVVYFVVLLLYYASEVPTAGDPRPVVGFDHDERGQRTPHDVLDEGLHMDVYRNGEKHDVVTDFPPVYSAEEALSTAIRHTRTNADRHVSSFERWHDV
jgi:hypothetical protein